MSFVTAWLTVPYRLPVPGTVPTTEQKRGLNFPKAEARRSNLEEPVLVEGEADGCSVVEGDEGGRLEDEAARGAGLRAAAGPPTSSLLLDNTNSL